MGVAGRYYKALVRWGARRQRSDKPSRAATPGRKVPITKKGYSKGVARGGGNVPFDKKAATEAGRAKNPKKGFGSNPAAAMARKKAVEARWKDKDPATIRNKRISLALSKSELDMIDEKAAEKKLSRIDLIVTAVKNFH
jgi:hypothetical protein